jgi:hypothetical protein
MTEPKTWNRAIDELTAPGARFELTDATLEGRPYKVFKNTPPSLRQLFDTARRRGGAVFLVYEDERWTFEQVMERGWTRWARRWWSATACGRAIAWPSPCATTRSMWSRSRR